ncbi:unnamed protein product [Heterobilharzia americana]|nr:unnamed protein product [Heterobilharzia americana]
MMTYRYQLLIATYIFSCFCDEDASKAWSRFLQNPSRTLPFSFRKATQGMVFPDAGSLMRTYSRGFPRGISGTVLFPDIYKAAESSTPAYPFWSKYDQFVYHENQSLKKHFKSLEIN